MWNTMDSELWDQIFKMRIHQGYTIKAASEDAKQSIIEKHKSKNDPELDHNKLVGDK